VLEQVKISPLGPQNVKQDKHNKDARYGFTGMIIRDLMDLLHVQEENFPKPLLDIPYRKREKFSP